PAPDDAFAALDERFDRTVGLGHGEHADDVAAIGADAVADRRGHVHHRGGIVVRIAAGGTRAVLAAQGPVDVVPARVVAADVAPRRVVDDDAAHIGDRDAVAHPVLVEIPDPGADVAFAQPG